jgi:hypothetical protein
MSKRILNLQASGRGETRGLDRREAAAFVGLSPTAFDKARRENRYPPPTLPGGRYDRRLLDDTMDRLSGIRDGDEFISPLDGWRNRRGSG